MTTKKKPNPGADAFGRSIGSWMFLFFRAWLVMLALGGFSHEAGVDLAYSYWACLLGVMVVRLSISGLAVRTSELIPKRDGNGDPRWN